VLNQIRYTYQKRGVFYFNRMVPIDLGDRYESRRFNCLNKIIIGNASEA
jgi:hypothetical protein